MGGMLGDYPLIEVSEDPRGRRYTPEELARMYRGSPMDYHKSRAIEQFYRQYAEQQAAAQRAAERAAAVQRTREMWERVKRDLGGMISGKPEQPAVQGRLPGMPSPYRG